MGGGGDLGVRVCPVISRWVAFDGWTVRGWALPAKKQVVPADAPVAGEVPDSGVATPEGAVLEHGEVVARVAAAAAAAAAAA
eukprot:CAMPEP_0183797700 /NCGR_PEP_ID=MMETSP0803_2-20130417/16679_1 /TAXON_ID=195967 /ORGANISM="Crustomastix stigmata, Strain CCMP3273" /LENGTH=81 /DNA_ID=CAMNT_0026042373 /DNA_START=27 /DNA_END=268 /DNA_ORIENTATION=-